MNAFVNGIGTQRTETTNGMAAYKNTNNALLDLFFAAGSSRGKNINHLVAAAFSENRELAARLTLWLRDVRGGAGERQTFRNIMKYLEANDRDLALRMIPRIPELGRWDDMFIFVDKACQELAFSIVKQALHSGNALAAKWCPREKSAKRSIAVALRKFMELSPKQYRKMLSSLTKVVETQMCAKDWDNIEFSHVPSIAASRYRSAFYRNAETAFTNYVNAVSKGEAKVNASAIFPHDVLRNVVQQQVYDYTYNPKAFNATEKDFIVAQWEALPDYGGTKKVLPLVDVSGSMNTPVDKSGIRAMDVAVSLGLYFSEKNKSVYKDCILTFESRPNLMKISGDIISRVYQLVKAPWGGSTNLEAALKLILDVAVKNNVPAEDMPEVLMIFSDMQFNYCIEDRGNTAMEMIRREFVAAGYEMPNIVFWNIIAHGNAPVQFSDDGVALVSGYSPAIASTVMKADDFNPMAIMMNAISNPRYDLS